MTDISSEQKFEPCDVLVVEDELALAETISQFLVRGGLRVRTAHGAASALRTASIAPPRVAIIDYHIPGMNGLELAAKLRAELPALQIILMSANNLHFDRRTLDGAGVKVFVNKPMPPGPLRQAVIRLLQA
jgi:CheY-like chemotaxis protein